MSEPLRGVVVTHGELASALVDAVRHITGDDGSLVAVSNEGCGRDGLAEQLESAIGDCPCVVFVDLPSGSCLQASATYLRSHGNVALVAGVNLAMLLDFVYHRGGAPDEAAQRAVDKGGEAVRAFGG